MDSANLPSKLKETTNGHSIQPTTDLEKLNRENLIRQRNVCSLMLLSSFCVISQRYSEDGYHTIQCRELQKFRWWSSWKAKEPWPDTTATWPEHNFRQEPKKARHMERCIVHQRRLDLQRSLRRPSSRQDSEVWLQKRNKERWREQALRSTFY